jgi:hypothetical protein
MFVIAFTNLKRIYFRYYIAQSQELFVLGISVNICYGGPENPKFEFPSWNPIVFVAYFPKMKVG